jgi:hypothetical protein
MFAAFVAVIAYFSKQIPSGDTALAVGRPAPSFTLASAAGKQISSADLLKDHRGMLLVFYRGYW